MMSYVCISFVFLVQVPWWRGGCSHTSILNNLTAGLGTGSQLQKCYKYFSHSVIFLHHTNKCAITTIGPNHNYELHSTDLCYIFLQEFAQCVENNCWKPRITARVPLDPLCVDRRRKYLLSGTVIVICQHGLETLQWFHAT